jgi:hypothetical protein
MATSHDWETAPVPPMKAMAAPSDVPEFEIGSETTRVQLVLPAERVRMLDQLAAEAGLATRKDLFNNALALLNWAVREVRRGRVIASVDESAQRFTELQMPMLDAIAANATAKSSAR